MVGLIERIERTNLREEVKVTSRGRTFPRKWPLWRAERGAHGDVGEATEALCLYFQLLPELIRGAPVERRHVAHCVHRIAVRNDRHAGDLPSVVAAGRHVERLPHAILSVDQVTGFVPDLQVVSETCSHLVHLARGGVVRYLEAAVLDDLAFLVPDPDRTKGDDLAVLWVGDVRESNAVVRERHQVEALCPFPRADEVSKRAEILGDIHPQLRRGVRRGLVLPCRSLEGREVRAAAGGGRGNWGLDEQGEHES
mmetsp:Transcript_50531/g.167401  ORF Transcript_50531/g.167401 Transcript_50531/m.167401 type:complete len:253 (+) Transcript_50531:734-1492(+)